MIVVATATILPPLKVIRWCQWIMAKQKRGQIKWQTRRQTQQTRWHTQETQQDTQETQLTRRQQGFYRPTTQNRAPPPLLTKSDPRFGKLLIWISRKCFLFYYLFHLGFYDFCKLFEIDEFEHEPSVTIMCHNDELSWLFTNKLGGTR